VYVNGQPVVLSAAPNAGYSFVTWRENRINIGSTNPLAFNATGDRLLEAVFVANPCSPRPPVTVSISPGSGALLATVASTANIQAIRFISTDNTYVTINGKTDLSGAWTENFPANTPAAVFSYRRQVPVGAGTVRFEVTDGCGTWMSFVGGGPSAW
jgi:hypothetical protein